MRGGEGVVLLRHLEKERLTAAGALFAVLTLAPGCSIGEHTHTGDTELLYFVSGEGTALDDGVARPVRAGDAMTTPDGHSHSVVNTGTEPLVMVASIIRS